MRTGCEHAEVPRAQHALLDSTEEVFQKLMANPGPAAAAEVPTRSLCARLGRAGGSLRRSTPVDGGACQDTEA